MILPVRFYTGLLFFLLAPVLYAQNFSGQVVDAETNAPVADAAVVLSGTGKFAPTGPDGRFEMLGVADGSYTVIVSATNYLTLEQPLEVRQPSQQVLTVLALRRDPTANTSGDIPTVTLEEAEANDDGSGEVANILNANRDVFQSQAAYNWSAFRFNERGYDSENFPVLLNGVAINDPETGTAYFGEFGGLNDVLRNRESTTGLNASEFSFGGIGGATMLDTRASVQRKQIRVSYAAANRTYKNRVMLTASTGLMPGGWAVTVSGSRRWAEEAYVEGTFFDGYSYFLSVDKKFGDRHGLNLTVLGAPVRRGGTGDSFQEAFDLAGTHYYNPLWGFQNGEKRNSAVNHSHQPIGLLRYDWKPSTATSLTATAYGQTGERGSTRLEWFDAFNPSPDYNRRLPSSVLDSALSAQQAKFFREDPAYRQLNWDAFYDANRINTVTVENADGIPGNTVSGKRSNYIVEDRRSDSREAGGNLILRHSLSTRLTLNGGGNYLWYNGENYKVVDDLLGGDFFVDQNKFILQDNPAAADHDLQTPNRIVREGDVFGYNYDENIRRYGVWAQAQVSLARFQLFAGGETGQTQYWRTGRMQNGAFPSSSLGDSEKYAFQTWAVKGGATYKINGRNYLYANGYTGVRAPQFNDFFLSPRVTNLVTPQVDVSEIQGFEGGYQLRAPYYKARITGFLTDFRNESDGYTAYSPNNNIFGNIHLSRIDRRHVGIEIGLEGQPVTGWTFSGAASIGKYQYTNRPLLFFTDDQGRDIQVGETVYRNNFFVPQVPQTAATVGVDYSSKRFWFASLSFNWSNNFYYRFDPTRRVAEAVLDVEPDSELWHTILDQKKAPAAYTVDFFGGKSWRIRSKYFLYLNVGINNLLDNQNIVTSGRDAYLTAFRTADDIRLYSNEIQYAFGRNYFVSLTFRI
jgi:hypothetical protein